MNGICCCVLFGVGGVGCGVYGSGAAIERDEKQVGVWGVRLRVLGVGSPREPPAP